MRLRRRRHRCPPGIELEVYIGGELVIGPIRSDYLAYITRFAGGGGELELVTGAEEQGCRLLAAHEPPLEIWIRRRDYS